METYQIDQVEPTPKQRTLNALKYASMYFAILVCWMLCWEYFWPSTTGKRDGGSEILVKAFFVSVFWGACMSIFFKSSKRQLLVTDESITVIDEFPGLRKSRLSRRTVHKGRIRTIREFKDRSGSPKGALLSERSLFAAQMMGFVFIPASLPEYEQLKNLAEGWRVAPG